VSGPSAEGVPPNPDPEWLRRYEAKMRDLMEERERRQQAAAEGRAAWETVEQRVDEAIAERAKRKKT
jgi:hypothetical protein